MHPSDQSLAINELKESEPRFAFGKNWTSFLARLTDERLDTSRRALIDLLGTSNLRGKRVLDIGCGSGLFSLAAASMGAETLSFDYDADSVACATDLRRRFAKPEWLWRIERASILDAAYIASLGDSWDFVYSWGVLHHTGQMARALENAGGLVASGGVLAIAIYNDQEQVSRRWTAIKRNYVNRPLLRPALALYALAVCWGKTFARDSLRLAPLATWNKYGIERGMSAWHDLIDWVGGYPFEVAKPEEIFDFYQARGFRLERLITRQGRGCNEFRFRRETAADRD